MVLLNLFQRNLCVKLWVQFFYLDVKAGSNIWAEDSQTQLCRKLTGGTGKESRELDSRPTAQEGFREPGNECFKDKNRREGWERKQKQRWESNRPKRASFSQRVMLNVTTGYLIPATNEVFN